MSRIKEFQRALKEADGIHEDFADQGKEHRNQLTIEHALDAAMEILDEGSDGSAEEYDYLVSALAAKLQEKIHGRLQSLLLAKRLRDRISINRG